MFRPVSCNGRSDGIAAAGMEESAPNLHGDAPLSTGWAGWNTSMQQLQWSVANKKLVEAHIPCARGTSELVTWPSLRCLPVCRVASDPIYGLHLWYWCFM